METLSSSALARAAGVNLQTIRYYERRGLIAKPPRAPSGYRLFPPDALRRVRFIKEAQGLGFTLKEVRGLLDLRVRPGVGCADILARARLKIADIQAKIAGLHRMEEALLRVSGRCSGRGPVEECPLLETLDEGQATEGRGSAGRNPRNPVPTYLASTRVSPRGRTPRGDAE